MGTLVLRLNPGDDLRASLDSALKQSGDEAAFVVSGIGSLSGASIRFAPYQWARAVVFIVGSMAVMPPPHLLPTSWPG